jgi:hypothetical protein
VGAAVGSSVGASVTAGWQAANSKATNTTPQNVTNKRFFFIVSPHLRIQTFTTN